jgi:LmbE family N-acetylglucosaminyl deacetylase
VDDPADLIVDVSAFLDQKEAAALCHATQNALFVRRRSERAGRQVTVREALLTEEAFHRHWPASPVDGDAFVKWLS